VPKGPKSGRASLKTRKGRASLKTRKGRASLKTRKGRASFKTRKGLVQGLNFFRDVLIMTTAREFFLSQTSPSRVLKEARPLRVFNFPDFGQGNLNFFSRILS
jgi:hypothetical protein